MEKNVKAFQIFDHSSQLWVKVRIGTKDIFIFFFFFLTHCHFFSFLVFFSVLYSCIHINDILSVEKWNQKKTEIKKNHSESTGNVDPFPEFFCFFIFFGSKIYNPIHILSMIITTKTTMKREKNNQ